MTELYDSSFEPRVPVVDGLLNSGTYIFAGAPKVGKSFLMAQLGIHVSKGIPLWDYKVNKGDVLYLALEDDYSRLQKRISQMYGVEGSDNFHLVTEAPALSEGLDAQLEMFLKEYPECKLIIIDTLQLSRKMFPELPNHKLDTLITHLHVVNVGAHRAVNDAEATAEQLRAQLETYAKQVIDKYNASLE